MPEKRIGIKEIANLAGISAGNVSMVLSGRGDKARISKTSQQRVLDVARQLNYRPNIYAKRLRTTDANRLLIGVFFTPDKHASIVGRFFAGIHDIIQDDNGQGLPPEIVLYPYTRNQLPKLESTIRNSFFNGALFMGMSKDDDMFLENQEFKIPVVLFNRHSEHYSSVCTDNLSIGRNAAQLFAQNQIRRACLVTGEKLSLPGEERMYGFINECERLSVPLPKHLIFRVDKMLEGGKQAGNLIPVDSGAPDGVFFSESFMAVSALHCLQRRGASIPERMSLLCYGDESSEEFTIPSLSSIRMPIEEMSHDCIRLLMEVSQSGSIELRSVLHQPTLILRESFEPRKKDAVMHE